MKIDDKIIEEISLRVKEFLVNDAVKLPVEICRDGVELPKYANKDDAGMDIRAAIDCILKPREKTVIPTGIKMVIPRGYQVEIRPRSGLSSKTPLIISNSPGTIDGGYRDELGVIIENSSLEGDNIYFINEKGNKQGIYEIKAGERIAQMVLMRYEKIEFEVLALNAVSSVEGNRGGGFGSSGTK